MARDLGICLSEGDVGGGYKGERCDGPIILDAHNTRCS